MLLSFNKVGTPIAIQRVQAMNFSPKKLWNKSCSNMNKGQSLTPIQKSVTITTVKVILLALTAKSSPYFLHQETCIDSENYGVASWVKDS